jgi:hypothetical protein
MKCQCGAESDGSLYECYHDGSIFGEYPRCETCGLRQSNDGRPSGWGRPTYYRSAAESLYYREQRRLYAELVADADKYYSGANDRVSRRRNGQLSELCLWARDELYGLTPLDHELIHWENYQRDIAEIRERYGL